MDKNSILSKFISTQGYKKNSPDKHRPMNVIPSNQITMSDVEFPVIGVDNLGNQIVMQPGQDYTFPGDYVIETPMKQNGGWLDTYQKGKEVISNSKDDTGLELDEREEYDESFEEFIAKQHKDTIDFGDDGEGGMRNNENIYTMPKYGPGWFVNLNEQNKLNEISRQKYKDYIASPVYQQTFKNHATRTPLAATYNPFTNLNIPIVNFDTDQYGDNAAGRYITKLPLLSGTGQIEIYDDSDYNNDELNTIIGHELSHASDDAATIKTIMSDWDKLEGNYLRPNSFRGKYKTYYPQHPDKDVLVKDIEYITQPTEVRARINSIRQFLFDNNINWHTTDYEQIYKYIQEQDKNHYVKDAIEDIKFLGKDMILKLMREYAQNNDNNKSLEKAQLGIEVPNVRKVLDYSKRVGKNISPTIMNAANNSRKNIINYINNISTQTEANSNSILNTTTHLYQNIVDGIDFLNTGNADGEMYDKYHNQKFKRNLAGYDFSESKPNSIEYIDKISIDRSKYILDPNNISKTCKDSECASRVTNTALAADPKIFNTFSLNGSAWLMFDKAEKEGATIIDNIFNGNQPTTYNKAAIKKYIQKTALDETHKKAIFENAEPGDIVGLFYPPSENYQKAFNESGGKNLNTHIGEIVEIKGKRYIRDNIGNKLYYRPIEKIINGTDPSGILITGLLKPEKKMNYFLNDNSVFIPNTEHENKPNFNRLFNKTSTRILSSIDKNRKVVQHEYNLSDEELDNISKLSYGIMFQESLFGESEKNDMYNWSSGRSYFGKINSTLLRLGNLIENTYDISIPGVKTESVGLSNIKFKDFYTTEELKRKGFYDIIMSENKDVYESPEFSAAATLDAVAKNYHKIKALLHGTKYENDWDMINTLIPIAHNQGLLNPFKDVRNYKKTGDDKYLEQYRGYKLPNNIQKLNEKLKFVDNDGFTYSNNVKTFAEYIKNNPNYVDKNNPVFDVQDANYGVILNKTLDNAVANRKENVTTKLLPGMYLLPEVDIVASPKKIGNLTHNSPVIDKYYKNYTAQNRDDVKKIQKELIANGYKLVYGADGYFGDETKKAYEDYLKKKASNNWYMKSFQNGGETNWLNKYE